MKNLTLKRMLFSAAIAGFTAAGMHAQSINFTDNRSLDAGMREQHRTVATWADLNNDDKMDLYYGGTSGTNGWAGRGCFAINNGNGFDVTWSDDTPRSSYGRGSVAFDYNQNGNVDLLIQSRGGNDTGTCKRFLLIKNNGDNTYTESDAVSSIINENFWYWNNASGSDNWESSDGTLFNGENELGTIATADYDKDGYPDLLIMGKTTRNPDEDRITKSYVRLLHNNGGTGFTEVTDAGLEQFSEGAVAFADFDNDGWFDILLGGGSYGNGQFRLYKNNQDGTFTEVESVKNKCIMSQGSMHVLDFNQDGKVDVILNGFVKNAEGKDFGRHTVVFLNTGENGSIDFDNGTDLTVSKTEGVLGTNEGFKKCDEIRDFNGDGWVDFIINGWSDNHNNWVWGVSSSKGAYNSYDLTESAGGSYWVDNCMSFGDVNGDFLADGAGFNWWSDGEGVRFSINSTSATVTSPAEPQEVTATYDPKNKTITLAWNGVTLPGSNGKAMYNIYIKDMATGKTHVLVAANTETGFQKVYMPFCNYLLTNEYTFKNVEAGTYEVGVQAVAYNYSASRFVTTTIKEVKAPAETSIDALTEKTGFAAEEVLTLTAADATVNHVELYIKDNATEEYLISMANMTKGEDGTFSYSFFHAIPFYEGHDYDVTFELYAKETLEEGAEGPAPSKLMGIHTVTVKGLTEPFSFSNAKLTAVTPSEETEISAEEDLTVVLTFDSKVTPDAEKTFINEGLGLTAPFASQSSNEEGTVWTFVVSKENFASKAELTLAFGFVDENGKVVEGNEGGEAQSYFMYVYSVASAGNVATDLVPTVTPENETTVAELSTIELQFDEEVCMPMPDDIPEGAVILMQMRGNGVPVTIDYKDWTVDMKTVLVTLETPLKAGENDGVYALTIKEGLMWDNAHENNNKAGSVNPTLTYRFEVGEKAEFANEYIPESITPAAEGKYTSLKEFTLTFKEGTFVMDDSNAENIYLLNKADNSKVETELLEYDNELFNIVKIVLKEEVTAAGSYTLVIPEGKLQQGSDEWGNSILDNAPALAYEFTVDPTVGVAGILADDAKADVYSVSGVLVLKNADRVALKNLKKGIYVINGKKVVVK